MNLLEVNIFLWYKTVKWGRVGRMVKEEISLNSIPCSMGLALELYKGFFVK